jgi:beta-phosphoglucomutase
MSIDAIIFDFNGVFVDDEPVHFSLFSEVLAKEGVTLSETDYIARYLGYDDRRCFETVFLDSQKVVNAAYIDRLIAQKACRYTEVAREGIRFFPAVSETLGIVAEQWPVAICSGALRAEIEYSLNLLNRLDRISVIISAEDTIKCKPHPEGYHLTLTALRKFTGDHRCGMNSNVNKRSALTAANCLVIEDSLAGIASAKSAGMRAIGVPNTYSEEKLLDAGADDVILDLRDLTPTWINRRFAS